MHDLASLVEHLHLLLGIAVICEDVNLRDHVVSQLVGELADCDGLALHNLLILLLKFGHSLGSCAGG